MTAAIYARRRLLKTLVITMDIGGQVVLTENIENYLTEESSELGAGVIILDIGRDIKLDYAKDLVKTNDNGKIMIDKECKTNCEGLFAAGDITDTPYAQAIIAAGQGATAILTAYNYLMKGKEPKVCY